MITSGEQLTLRQPGRCSQCSDELALGTVAWWDPEARTVTCLVCLCEMDVQLSPEAADAAHREQRRPLPERDSARVP